jgi:hypothetical protein
MNIWQGVEVNTKLLVTVSDSPLRITLVDIYTGERLIFHGPMVKRMVIATSMMLGTALYALLPDDEGGLMVIEAAAEDDIPSGRYMAALAEARQQVEREIELERIWNDAEDDPGDDFYQLLQRFVRDR